MKYTESKQNMKTMQYKLHFLILISLSMTVLFMGNKTKLINSQNQNAIKPLYNGVDIEDSLALVALYEATDGDNWSNNQNWLVGRVNSWYGISVHNNNGRVITISLPDNNLVGILPSEIGNLDRLVFFNLKNNNITLSPEIKNLDFLLSLNLSGNQIYSLIPEIGDLFYLETLDLSNNNLVTLPSEIGNLKKLRDLSLRNNTLYFLPPEIGNLDLLSSLNLEYNFLHYLPLEIGNLFYLQVLNLDHNFLTSLPPEIGNLENLTWLDLQFNELTSLPPEIGNLENLERLELLSNELNYVPSEIGNLKNLDRLGIWFNKLISVPPEIGNLKNLTWLDFYSNKLTELPPEIGNLEKLELLDIGDNQLTSLPPKIGNLSNLSKLLSGYNQLTSLPPEIGNLENLTYLTLQDNQLTSLPPEIGNLNNLTNLSLEDNQLTSLPLEIENLTNLERLHLHNNKLTYASIEDFTYKNIEKLYYYGQAKIGNVNIGILNLGVPFERFISAGGTATHYQWYKNEMILEGEIDSLLYISNPTFLDVGTYHCIASNDIATELTLESEPQYLILPSKKININQNGGGDYSSISMAIADLAIGNIELQENESIIFDIAPNSGPYNEQIIVPEIEGTNARRTININGNGNTFTFDGTTCENPAILQINGADYVVIANMNIEVAEDVSGGWGIHLKNEADNVQIINCSINANPIATESCFAGIVASNSDRNYLNNESTLGSNANNTTIQNCNLVGGYAAIAMIGSQDTTMFGPNIIGNTITDSYRMGILTTFSNGAVVDGNQIDMTNFNVNGSIAPSGEDAFGIAYKCVSGQLEAYFKKLIDIEEAQKGRSISVQNNQLKGIEHLGISMIDCYRVGKIVDDRPQAPLALIANNTIEGKFNDKNSLSAGIYLEKSRRLNCYHNSIQMDGEGSNLETALFVKEGKNITVLNNSLAYTGDNGYSIYVEDNSGIGWDYNNYYKGNSPTLAHYNGEDYFTLEEIIGNPNSISTEPQFIFTFNDDSELLDTASTGVASLIPFDFEGDVRPDPITLKPDIGANEFVIGVFDSTFNQVVDALLIEYTTANQWQHVFKNDSIAVSIHSTADLGEISTDLYIHNQATVRQLEETFYLDRNFRLEAENGFTAGETVQIRLYITQRELDRLMEVDEQINSFKDLNLTYLDKGLEADIGVFSVEGGATKFFAQQNSQQISKNAYLLEYTLTGITQLGEFWLHGGDEALVVGIEDVVPTFEGLSIYPNPFDEHFTLELDSPVSAQTDVVLMDIRGKVVYRYSFEAVLGEKRYELEFPSDLSNGLYFVEVQQGDKKEVRKVLKR